MYFFKSSVKEAHFDYLPVISILQPTKNCKYLIILTNKNSSVSIAISFENFKRFEVSKEQTKTLSPFIMN